jgi:hypothetical protein
VASRRAATGDVPSGPQRGGTGQSSARASLASMTGIPSRIG